LEKSAIKGRKTRANMNLIKRAMIPPNIKVSTIDKKKASAD
jgi:hypothetical protein